MPKDDGPPREPVRTIDAAAGGGVNAIASSSTHGSPAKARKAAAAAEAKVVLRRNQVNALPTSSNKSAVLIRFSMFNRRASNAGVGSSS